MYTNVGDCMYVHPISKVFNVVFRLEEEQPLEDPIVLSFNTRYEAKRFYDKCKDYIYTCYEQAGINEVGKETKGNMATWTDSGPYLYVRLIGCKLCSSAFRVGEYFRKTKEGEQCLLN